jgi:hypothetical protein
LSAFEAILGASVTLLLGIPVLMDKVMRPRYEERFEKFRQESRDEFLEAFEEALQKLKQAKDTINPDTVRIMESLFTNWDQIRANENRLQFLISVRKYLFLGWMASITLSILSISYSNLVLLKDFSLGQLTMAVFGLMAALSAFYGMAMFSLDEKLAKFGKSVETRDATQSHGVSNLASSFMVIRGREMESRVEDTLRKFSIPYEIGRFTIKGQRVLLDYAIPSSTNPSFVIEVKRRLLSPGLLNDLFYRLDILREAFPNVKGVMVLNIEETSAKALEAARSGWQIIDFRNVDDLSKIIKL